MGLDQNGVTVHDCSKFGVLVDGVRLDASDTNDAVFLRRRGEKKSCEVKFGCVKPVVYTARLVFTEEEEEEGAQDLGEATTDGDVTDAEAEAGDDTREDENEAPDAAPTPNPAQADALHAASRPAQTNFGTADVTEGKATTVFERLPPPRVRNGPPGGSNRDDPEPLEPTAVNFKKFKKQKLGLPGIEPATTTGRGARSARAAPPRRNIIRYADEAYDALPQWEDASGTYCISQIPTLFAHTRLTLSFIYLSRGDARGGARGRAHRRGDVFSGADGGGNRRGRGEETRAATTRRGGAGEVNFFE